MVRIAISGKAKSGKNSFASFLISHATKISTEGLESALILAFADPIKHTVLSMFPKADENCLFGPSELRSEVIPGDYKDKNGNLLTYRQALMDIGALGRSYDENFWIDKFNRQVKTYRNVELIIASDLRFVNEFEYLKDNSFFTVRILRNDCAIINDSSETEQDTIPNSKFDLIIYNNASINDLDKSAKTLIKSLFI